MAIKIVCVTVCIKASEAKNYSEKENVNKKTYISKHQILTHLADHWVIVDADFTAFCYSTITPHLQHIKCP